MMSCKNELVSIPIENWPHLMDMYKIDWPKHFVTFYAIKNYIDWKCLSDHKRTGDEFKFYSLNGDWSDGTHMIIDSNNHVFFNTLSNNFSRLNDLLQLLQIQRENHYLFVFVDRFEPTVTEFLSRNNLIDDGGNTAYLYYLNKEIALNFDIRPPDGYKFKPLLESHADFANSVWLYKYPGSEDYLKKLIRRNLNLGLFDKNDSLIAWCLRVEYGLLGTLQVIDSHKRKGLGSLVIKALAKLSAENDFNTGASMDLMNFSSQNLFEKVGFQRVDKLHYVRPKLK